MKRPFKVPFLAASAPARERESRGSNASLRAALADASGAPTSGQPLEVRATNTTRAARTGLSWRGAVQAGAFVFGGVVLFGCPIYSGSSSASGCDPDETYCCNTNYDCPQGSFCYYGTCSTDDGGYGDGGADGDYDATTDCSQTPCPSGYQCTLTNGSLECIASDGGTGEGGTGDATTDGTTGDGDTGTPTDAGSDAPVFPPFTGCTSDTACAADAGAGARCIDGQCVAAANECSDSTQCPIVGTTQEDCVQGVCTPSCGSGAACPTGYACDSSTSVCTVNASPCGAADGGAACGTGTTCVDEHCVPLCTTSTDASADAGATSCSGTGLVCVDHGCIPDQKAQFICNTEGVQDNCASGSICLHHSCYIACTLPDSGSTCQHADNFNLCKPVQTSTGTYDVCGSSTNLGNQCDPTQGVACASPAICIDGYCR